MKSYGTIFKPTGFVTQSNIFGGYTILVQINDAGDAIRHMSEIIYKEGKTLYKKSEVSKWQEIKYNKDGMPYFRLGNKRVFLDEVYKII